MRRHLMHPLRLYGARTRRGKGNDHIRAAHGFRQATSDIIGVALHAEQILVRELSLARNDVLALVVKYAPAVAGDNLVQADATGPQEPERGHVGCAHADHGESGIADIAVGELEGIEQPGEEYGGCPLLVIMEDRDLDGGIGSQHVQHLKTAWLGNVLEIDAPKGRLDEPHSADQVFRRPGIQAERDGIDASQVLKEQRLALHNRHPRARANIAQAEHARAIGNDRHRIGFVGIVVNELRIGRDGSAGCGNARRIPDGKVIPIPHRHLGSGLDLAAVVGMQAQCLTGGTVCPGELLIMGLST